MFVEQTKSQGSHSFYHNRSAPLHEADDHNLLYEWNGGAWRPKVTSPRPGHVGHLPQGCLRPDLAPRTHPLPIHTRSCPSTPHFPATLVPRAGAFESTTPMLGRKKAAQLLSPSVSFTGEQFCIIFHWIHCLYRESRVKGDFLKLNLKPQDMYKRVMIMPGFLSVTAVPFCLFTFG